MRRPVQSGRGPLLSGGLSRPAPARGPGSCAGRKPSHFCSRESEFGWSERIGHSPVAAIYPRPTSNRRKPSFRQSSSTESVSRLRLFQSRLSLFYSSSTLFLSTLRTTWSPLSLFPSRSSVFCSTGTFPMLGVEQQRLTAESFHSASEQKRLNPQQKSLNCY